MNVTIIGAGSWGIALASLLNNNGHNVKMWSKNVEEVEIINTKHCIARYLPDFIIPSSIIVYESMKDALDGADIIILAVPSAAIRECAKQVNNYTRHKIIINVAKGIEDGTLKRLSEVIKEEMPSFTVVTLSGPSHAEEVAKKNPTVVTVASDNSEARHFVAEIFRNEYFRVYPNEDIIGVETAGALKNAIAICVGIVDGLGFGDNAKAALITRGLAEITRLGIKMGAKLETFFGLSGVGDLVVTCGSRYSRNYKAGVLLAQGNSLKVVLSEINMVVEGINTIKGGKELGAKYGIELPIIEQASKILFEGKNPRTAAIELMTREEKEEWC